MNLLSRFRFAMVVNPFIFLGSTKIILYKSFGEIFSMKQKLGSLNSVRNIFARINVFWYVFTSCFYHSLSFQNTIQSWFHFFLCDDIWGLYVGSVKVYWALICKKRALKFVKLYCPHIYFIYVKVHCIVFFLTKAIKIITKYRTEYHVSFFLLLCILGLFRCISLP